MKNFKTRFLSFVLCICMCLSIFSGCSLIIKRDNGENDAAALKIGDTVVTRQELINSYYSFYEQNYYYFMYYDEDYIMEVFYDSVIAREIILAEANKMLEDKTLVFTEEDMADIWNDVFDYIYAQIDEKEKAILLLADSDEDNLPERLQDEESDTETAYKYEPYKFEEVVKIDYSDAESAPEYNINDKIAEFEDGVYTYNNATDDEDRNMVPIEESEKANRLKAYNMYLSDLMLSAKANGRDSKRDAVLKAEIERIYESYYENALYTKYQEYINSTIVEEGLLTDSAIVEKYKELLNASIESNTVEDNYISVITSTETENLVLYHYNGKYVYFSVQHVLISFDDETLEILKNTEGYDTAKDKIFRDYYEQVRALYVSEDMTTSYRDEDGYIVKNADTGEDEKISIAEIRQLYNSEVEARLETLRTSSEYAQMTPEQQSEAETRVRTLLFQEFTWKYSGDTGSLTNDALSGVLGFTISSETDNHGSFVKDFANGARALYEAYLTNADGTGIGETISSVVSDYGVHLMMLTGVYEAGEVVSVTDKSDAEIIEDLKSTYISNLTEQTLYEYVYDLVKDSLIGDDGTFFSDFRNELVKKYEDEGLIVYVDKMSYSELNDAIN